jgi:hypothetical protein
MLKVTAVENFELVELKNGVMSLRALEPRETFHPGIGPIEEASILHVSQQRIVERCQRAKNFCLWDVGLGAAANAITAIRALRTATFDQGQKIEIHSFDKTLSPLRFALENAQSLGYLLGYEELLEELASKQCVSINPHIQWTLHLGNFCENLKEKSFPSPDAIFYDPYSPIGNPEMWTLQHFSELFKKLPPDRPCLLSNYTRSTQIRVALLLAGFFVGIGCVIDMKAETTLASNDLSLLKQPLDRLWLEKRVRVSHNAAPLRSSQYQILPISDEDYEALLKHPQFRE